ncbi:MAG: C25 family cysteine peptidase [Syntrophothermus sp.]
MNKVSTFLFSFLIVFFFTSFRLFAGEIIINNGRTGVVFDKGSYQQVSFSSRLSTIQFREIATSAGIFTEFYTEGYGYANIPGDPKLPVYKQLVEVPAGARYTIRITDQVFHDYDLSSFGITYPLIPAQPPVSKNSDPSTLPFHYNPGTYQQNKWLGEPLVTITNAGSGRAVSMARVEVSPVQYNPVTGQIRVYESFNVKIIFEGADISSVVQAKRRSWSPYYQSLYRLLPNYQEETDSLITSAPVTYVVISSPLFKTALRPFINWKKKKGFQVIEGYTDDPAVGTTTASIKTWLQNLYNNPPAGFQKPAFVLFAGDVPQIPAFMSNGHPSDMYYCDLTNDHIPEMFYGRFSASSLVQLQPYIDKTLEYEQYTMPSDAFLGEVTMVAGADATHQLTWGNGQINYGTTYYFNSAHNLLSHTYLQPEPAGGNYSANIRQNVSDGVGYANYTAHGSETGWSDPAFNISQIPPLQNNHEYCLMVGNCCLTAKYSVNCFAEEITRAEGKGALGYIGCSDYSYWDEDYWWGCGFKAVTSNPSYDPNHLGAYDVTFHDQGIPESQWFVTQGQMVQGGNFAVEQSNSGMKLYYWEAYNLMGDPSLSAYFSVPPALTATYPDNLLMGTSTLQVVTEPYVYAALTVHDTVLIAAQCSDASGVINFTFNPLQTPDTLSLVMTKQNRKPHLGHINVIPATGPYVVVSSTVVNDLAYGNQNRQAEYGEKISLDVTLKNIGILSSGNVNGTISSGDTNVTILINTHNFGILASGDTVKGIDCFSIQVKNSSPDQHPVVLQMVLSDGTHSWNAELRFKTNSPVITITDMIISDPAPGGNGNGVLDPGETAILKIHFENTGHALSGNTISHLVVAPGGAPYIIVNNPVYYAGSFPPATPAEADFQVVTNGITPAGTCLDLQNIVTTGNQSQFSAEKIFNTCIGLPPIYLMSNNTITTCSGTFYDSGGPNGSYMNNEDFVMTFSSPTPGATLRTVFSQFDVEPQSTCNYDYLKAFNGPNTTSPLLGTWCGQVLPSEIIASSGQVTFQFHSDYSENLTGWTATVSCSGGTLGLSANAFPADVCAGSTTQLVAIPSGGSGNYTYQWSPATWLDDPYSKTPVSTPEGNITYTVTVNDGTNSLTSSPVDITVLPVPATPVISLVNNDLISNATEGNQWFLNGALVPGATAQTLAPTISGEYYVVVTGTNGCPSEPSNTIAFAVTGTENPGRLLKVKVFPNPSQGIFTITCDLPAAAPVVLRLTDGTGRVILTRNVSGSAGKNSISISEAGLSNGIYYLRLSTEKSMEVSKIIISK